MLRVVDATSLRGTGGTMLRTYLGPSTSHALDAELPVLLLSVGLVGAVSALLDGRLVDTHGRVR